MSNIDLRDRLYNAITGVDFAVNMVDPNVEIGSIPPDDFEPLTQKLTFFFAGNITLVLPEVRLPEITNEEQFTRDLRMMAVDKMAEIIEEWMKP